MPVHGDSMVTPVEVALLGPVEVRIDGRAVAVPGASLRLLAILATQPGRVCSLASIVDGLWGEAATERAEGAVHTYVSRLRRALADGGASPDLVASVAPGYRLMLDPEAVDGARFRLLAEQGRRALAANQPRLAAARLGDALALWRGEPLADLGDPPFAALERDRLT